MIYGKNEITNNYKKPFFDWLPHPLALMVKYFGYPKKFTILKYYRKKEKNKIQDNTADINKNEVVIIWDILKLKFFPKKKQNKKLRRGRKITKWAIKIDLPF